MTGLRNALTIDVEEWFHLLDLPSTPEPARWQELPATVERNTHHLLEIFGDAGVRGTFFVLGWVAARYPGLVRDIHAAGHEIASHGDLHELVYVQGAARFEEDLKRARGRLGDLTGEAVLGYRAPGFSITPETPWAFEVIHRVGFRYDASLFPARRGHGGAPGAPAEPHRIPLASGAALAELPMSVLELGPLRLPFSGGGYLRLFPYALLDRGIARLNARGRPVCLYVHPREIDPDHPRLAMNARRRFKSYVNLESTEPKLRRALGDHRFDRADTILRGLDLLD